MKVLIADDDPVCCRLLQATLSKNGFDVIAARDGNQAVALAREHKPGLVITDIIMPGMDGYELCSRLKSEHVLDGAPVILLTALSDPEDVIRALQSHADGFVTKPFDKDFLLGTIADLTFGGKRAASRKEDGTIELIHGGRNYTLDSDAAQLSRLLLSTYDNAVQKNKELRVANEALIRARDEIRAANEDLLGKQKLIDRDLEAAAGIQRSLLPNKPPATSALEVRWRFEPCQRIGGDIFNVLQLDDRHYGFYMLDVSGHGVPSALVTVSASQALKADSGVLVRRDGETSGVVSPAEVMRWLDGEYPMERFDKFFTIAYVVVDGPGRTLRCSSAGHPPALLQTARGDVRLLESGGPIVGMGFDLPYDEETIALEPGDRVFLYTDGVVEHQSPEGELYGMDRLTEVLSGLAGASLDGVLDGVMNDLAAFNPAPPTDDVSLLGFALKG